MSITNMLKIVDGIFSNEERKKERKELLIKLNKVHDDFILNKPDIIKNKKPYYRQNERW